MKLARSTYYDEPELQPIGEARLVEQIKAVCAEWPAYGYRRVTVELHDEGRIVNHKKVMRLMPWRLASAWGDSPPRNSWTTCPLNSIECVRCLAMGFLLESPVQLADSQVPYLSTRRGALQRPIKFRPSKLLFLTPLLPLSFSLRASRISDLTTVL